jgi:hypothetical protein
MPNEHDLTKRVREHVEALRMAGEAVWAAKLSGGMYQRPNLPDWVLCVNGLFVALETKHPDGSTQPTPGQARELELIQRAGGIAVVPRSLHEVRTLLAELKRRV